MFQDQWSQNGKTCKACKWLHFQSFLKWPWEVVKYIWDKGEKMLKGTCLNQWQDVFQHVTCVTKIDNKLSRKCHKFFVSCFDPQAPVPYADLSFFWVVVDYEFYHRSWSVCFGWCICFLVFYLPKTRRKWVTDTSNRVRGSMLSL